MHDPLERLYRTKLVLLAMLLIAVGIALLFFGHYVQDGVGIPWLRRWPILDIGGALFTTGLLGVALQYFDGQDSEERATKRLERVIANATPAMRDAVIDGFAANTEDLKRVATPEVLDAVATNALALRLGDEQFAREIYADVRDQAIRASERWHDVDVSIRLSNALETGTVGARLFDILVEWEYTCVPSHGIRKFAAVSDRDEFYELVTDVPATSVWFVPERTGVDASERSTFELLDFTVNGDPIKIRRSTRKTGQTYSVEVPDELLREGKPMRLRTVYRAVGRQDAHRLFVEIPVPARDVSLNLDYTGTDISFMTVTDTVTSLQKPRVTQMPEQLPGREVQVELPGWLLPRSGFAFVWTLSSEEPTPKPKAGRSAA